MGVWVSSGGETGVTGRKQAPRQFKNLVLEGKRGKNDELKKDQSGSAGAASALSPGKFKQFGQPFYGMVSVAPVCLGRGSLSNNCEPSRFL